MKTGNKILFASAGIIVFISVVLIVSTAFILFKSGVIIIENETGNVTSEYDFKQFSSLDLVGAANVEIVQSDEFSVSITAADNGMKNVNVEQAGGILFVKLNAIALNDENNYMIKISAPSLTKITCRGASKLTFTGFDETTMFIQSDGLNEIKCMDCRFENISLIGKGVINIDLNSSKVVNAVLDLDGLGSVMLNLNGGKLEGRLRNMISLIYRGSTSSVNIDKSTESEVVHK